MQTMKLKMMVGGDGPVQYSMGPRLFSRGSASGVASGDEAMSVIGDHDSIGWLKDDHLRQQMQKQELTPIAETTGKLAVLAHQGSTCDQVFRVLDES
jgi:hypothetical protein